MPLVRRLCPLLRQRFEYPHLLRPIVKRGRGKIRTMGPRERVYLGIDRDLLEQSQVAQGAVQLAGQDRPKIDNFFRAVTALGTGWVWGDLQNYRFNPIW